MKNLFLILAVTLAACVSAPAQIGPESAFTRSLKTNVDEAGWRAALRALGGDAVQAPIGYKEIGDLNTLFMTRAGSGTNGWLGTSDYDLFFSKQSGSLILTNLTELANSVGALHNDGSGNLSWAEVQPLSSNLTAFSTLGTTKGDLAVYNGTNWVRLPAGANGKVLSAQSAQPTGLLWADDGGGGGGDGIPTLNGVGTNLNVYNLSALGTEGQVSILSTDRQLHNELGWAMLFWASGRAFSREATGLGETLDWNLAKLIGPWTLNGVRLDGNEVATADSVTNYPVSFTNVWPVINTSDTNANLTLEDIAAGRSITVILNATESSVPCVVSLPANLLTNANLNLTVTNGTAKAINFYAIDGSTTNILVSDGGVYSR